MIPKDAQYLDEMVKLIKSRNITLKNEKQFLIEHKAMDESGTILGDYPKIVYIKGGDRVTHDEGGSLIGLNARIEQMKESGIHAWIEYFPRFMSFYLMAQKAIAEEYANNK
jgi:hypothetical protein